MKMKTVTSKLMLAVLCALTIISIVSGKSQQGNLRGMKGREDETVLDLEIKDNRILSKVIISRVLNFFLIYHNHILIFLTHYITK